MKHPSVFVFFLVILTACSSTPEIQPVIPGLTHEAVVDRARPDMLASASMSPHRYDTKLRSYMDGLDFSIRISGPDRYQVDTVIVRMKVNPEVGDITGSLPYLVEIACVSYDASDARRAKEWLRASFMLPESRITIGPAEFILLAPSDHERTLIIRGIE